MKCAFLGPVKTEKMGHFLRPPLYKEGRFQMIKLFKSEISPKKGKGDW